MERPELLNSTRVGNEIAELAEEGLTADEILRLMRLRVRVREQSSAEPTAEMKRLAFVRWLYHAGRVYG